MVECRFCKNMMQEGELSCPFCGFDPATGTVSKDFDPQQGKARLKRQKEKEAAVQRGAVRPGVKRFALVSLAVVVFSIFYKYNFNVTGVVSEITLPVAKLKRTIATLGGSRAGKNDQKDKKAPGPIELTSVGSFTGGKKGKAHRAVTVEGIFFDPSAKSFVTINGEVFSEGQGGEGFTVARIGRETVELTVGGEQKTLALEESIPLPAKK